MSSIVDPAAVLKRGYPKTKEEWWFLAKFHKDDLRNLICDFHPIYKRVRRDMRITAPNAETACAMVRQEIVKETIDDPLECFDQFLDQKSDGLVTILNQTWFGIPESLSCWDLKGFGVLCDLCSESYVLEPQEPEE